MSFEERISSENGGIEILGGANLVCGVTDSSRGLVSVSDLSPNLSGIKVQFGDPSPICGITGQDALGGFQSINQKTKSSEIGTTLNESFLVSISELRYIVLICIRWRLQNSSELSSNVSTILGIGTGSSIAPVDSPSTCGEESITPSKEYLVSNIFLYRSCISDSHRVELEFQVVRDILRLIDPTVESGGRHFSGRLVNSANRNIIKELAGGLDSQEANEMRNAESVLGSQFLLSKLPFPNYGTFLGKETAEYTIGDIINTTEHPTGLNLANVASTPSILGILLKYFDVSWPSHIFESLLKSDVVGGGLQQQEDNISSTVKDSGDVSLSLGSFTHVLGLCKPCVFVNKTNKKCRNGVHCCFCHFQHKERKRGKRYKSSANCSSTSNSCNNSGAGTGVCLTSSSGQPSHSGANNSGGIASNYEELGGGIGNTSGFGVTSNGAGILNVEGFSKQDISALAEDCLRVSSISPASIRGPHNIFGSNRSELSQGAVGLSSIQPAGMTAASGSQCLPDVLFSHHGSQQLQRYPLKANQGANNPLTSFQSSARSNSVFGKSSCPTGSEQQQQMPVRYLVPPPPPPPSKTSGALQIFQNEKDVNFRDNSNPVATSTSAGFNQLGTNYQKGSSDKHSMRIPGLVLDSCPFQSSQGASQSFNDSFFGDFIGYNKLINEASEMNNWISANNPENSSNAINQNSKVYGCFQWLDQPEIGESIVDAWGVGNTFDSFIKGNGASTSPQNLNQCLYDSHSYSKAAQDWTFASSIIKNSSINASNSASESSFTVNNHSNLVNPNSASSLQISTSQPSSQKLRESIIGSPLNLEASSINFHDQAQTQSQAQVQSSQALPELAEGVPNSHNDYFLSSPSVFNSNATTSSLPSSLSDNNNINNGSFIMPSGSVVPPFLRGNQGAGVSSEYSDCSPLSFLTGGGATNFGMDFCFLNSWK
ncbi:hypothetical protein [Cryptosporidium parvum Iowa II]|uniref:C3H1-type domain-containing protein n=2 Tax=Cryptosporidium parvum TaxID=5807 RepID=Q5CX11_CRYPI|nr:hypothetical protein [Cryptosporidium parvum Iowa II]QOY41179.1 Uncharacterized Protein CPATCC_0014510 [Cryptosporidium parvum]WKS78407.1 putative Zn finger-containing protein [Cryptosporidium sp. 43IA8]EAK89927.1 hypothetical protein cgd6_2950 [Cryptosporidium parvum Iowa II]WRK32899.1 Uncharacterized Protein cpbgf_6002950 [Cryptosporidium parvum]CAD98583.1 aob567, aof1001, aoe110, aoe264 and aoe130 genes, possible [Cryptosporidium parvum]|eukprot:QOY41179.1 hypothetical protein CPATCC_002834 [Cryptosporidium parvum]